MKNLNFENFEKLDLPFKVNRLSPNIGAELLEIDLRENFKKETYELIYFERQIQFFKIFKIQTFHLNRLKNLKFIYNLIIGWH